MNSAFSCLDLVAKKDFLGFRTYAHVFLTSQKGDEVDVYTDDQRFEAAFLAAYAPASSKPPLIRVEYEEVNKVKVNKVRRVRLEFLDHHAFRLDITSRDETG